MLNRKLTEADLGKEFSCNYAGTIIAVTLIYLEESRLPYCFGLLNPPEESGPINYWTHADGRSAFLPASVIVSEVEEPEEFRLTGKEVWRSATKEEQKELDDALGLKEISLKLNASVFDALEEKAKKQGISLKAMVRQILTDHVTNQ